jgi:hypothetical protein
MSGGDSDRNTAARRQFRPGGLNYESSLFIAFFGVFVPLCLFGCLASAVSNQRSLGWEAAMLKCLSACR